MYELAPISLREAQIFVKNFHRHNEAHCGQKFSIGLKESGQLIGVVAVGRPIAQSYFQQL
jgi:hypothetical protein